MRKLTVRQAAVLAAIERRAEATMLDLQNDFPKLMPSAVERVIRSLERRDLVRREGDDERVFLGGVTFRARQIPKAAKR